MTGGSVSPLPPKNTLGHYAAFLLSSVPGGVFVWGIIGLVAGLGLFFYGFRLLQRRRLILDTPFSKIRSASLGMVEVSGLAVGPYTMIAPVTAKPCYYYRTEVWEWKQSGKDKTWVKVAGECMHLPFFLDDNTGRVLVDPRGADLDLHRDFQQEFSDSFFTTKEPVPDNVRAFLSRNGIATSNKIRVEEFCIKPKNALFILGTLADNPGLEVTAQPIRDVVNLSSSHSVSVVFTTSSTFSGTVVGGNFDAGAIAERLLTRLVPQDGQQTHVIRLSTTTDPIKAVEMSQQQKIAAALAKAGISNPAAWAAAGLADPAVQVSAGPVVVADAIATSPTNGGAPGAAPLTAQTAALPGGFDPHPPVVLMKGTNNKTFMISWRSQQDVARSLGWKCFLMIWGGPILALFSLYVILSLARL